MTNNENPKELQNNKIDYLVASSKAVLGAIPGGSILTELVGALIPDQRLDRIAKFAIELNKKIDNYGGECIRLKLNNENFADLCEESFRQAAHALTDERREYICSIINSGINSEKGELIELKQLLRLLGEINDIEVIWLRFYMIERINGDVSFREKHKDTLEPILAHLGADRDTLDKNTLQNSYKEHLTQLGLLVCRYKVDNKTKQIMLDQRGKFEIAGYSITPLGRLLLKHIGLTQDGFAPLEEN